MNRAEYLTALGVSVYISRDLVKTVIPETPLPHILFLFQSSDPQHPLLQKIIEAIALPPEAIAICCAEQTPVELPSNPSKHMIVFGNNLAATLPPNAFVTVSLDELALNDIAKRALWQHLKTIKATYGH